MILPGRYDLTVPQRATLREGPFQLLADDVPVDLTDHDLVAQIYSDSKRTTKLLDLTIQWDDRAEGSFYITASHELTATMLRPGYWDLLVIEPSGDRFYWLEGRALLDRGLSEEEAAP